MTIRERAPHEIEAERLDAQELACEFLPVLMENCRYRVPLAVQTLQQTIVAVGALAVTKGACTPAEFVALVEALAKPIEPQVEHAVGIVQQHLERKT